MSCNSHWSDVLRLLNFNNCIVGQKVYNPLVMEASQHKTVNFLKTWYMCCSC